MLKRTFWGIIAAAVFTAVIILGGWIFTLAVLLFALAGLMEYFHLVERTGRKPYRFLTISATILFLLFSSMVEFRSLTIVFFMSLFVLFIGAIPVYYSRGRSFIDGAVSLYGFMYVSIPSGIAIFLRSLNPVHLLLIAGYTWINDSMALFTGKLLGRHKLAPTISPNKTWEGFAGGLISSIAFGYAFALYAGLNPYKLALFGLVLSITGTMGDLAESVIKREAGVKDSGKFLPGHGGILDRVDSFIINILAYFIMFVVLGIK